MNGGRMYAKRFAGVCAAVAALSMGLCQGASAGTVAYRAIDSRGLTYGEVDFTAATGETNDVSVTLTSEAAVITDTNPLQPDSAATSSHCTFSGDRAVCRTDALFPFAGTEIKLGDGNDTGRVITSAQRPSPIFPSVGLQGATIYGGPGNDTLIGSVGSDWLVGGTGADDLRGGQGSDWADYTQDGDQTLGAKVTLDNVADDGRGSEHDNVHSDVENVDGTTQGNNVLIGSDSDNVLMGHFGSDTLRGGAGNDTLYSGLDPGSTAPDTLDGGLGIDTLWGSGGDDKIEARDGLPDLRITCGDGNDVVTADSTDPHDTDCETVNTG
ncbi:MAG: calcium-binding protein [Gaiellaceae bacterium]